jgi:hypothetical protein
MTTEIETVTVDFEEMRKDVAGYLRLRKTKRLVITREGEEVLVLGPWLPDEKRSPAPEGFMRDLHAPPYPFHPDEANFADNLYAWIRENESST